MSARVRAHGDHVYLTDFGLTKRTSELSGGLTGTGHFLGTVDYVSPEQIQGRPVGSGTDIYALGCVLYECLTGQLPFRRDDDAALLWAHLVETPPPVTGSVPRSPPRSTPWWRGPWRRTRRTGTSRARSSCRSSRPPWAVRRPRRRRPAGRP